jgi:arylsulfatase A-like enzyme
MSKHLSRRDFLKLTGTVSAALAAPSYFRALQPARPAAAGRQNVLIVVFDAFSGYHLPLYGYDRPTAPNLARLAERAVVYHNHIAGGNFSTPGTASLFTGVLPWQHRAFKLYDTLAESFVDKTIFHAFGDYHRMVYSHNPLVTTLFDQLAADLDNYIPLEQFFLTSDGFVQDLFRNDGDIAATAWARAIKQEEGYSYSLFLSELYKQYQSRKIARFGSLFPLGLPNIRGDNYYILETAMERIGTGLGQAPQPFLGYFHFMPPHQPYHTELEFHNQFENDGLVVPPKPQDLFTQKLSEKFLQLRRREYDEFILYVDREFGKFYDRLEASGLLENTWLILTSDHGELFERGIRGHLTPVLYHPVVRVPLMIFEPGRRTRTDVHETTSAVDLLPTLLQVTGGQPANWTEGRVLPPFSGQSPDPGRSIYVLQAKETRKTTPLTKATVALLKGPYKLMYFFGYEELEGGEGLGLYDLVNDPEELNNLYSAEAALGREMLEELKSKLAEMNRPYV